MAIEKIFVQINGEVKELKGAEKEAFLIDQKQIQDEINAQIALQESLKQTKVSAYTKLGLTNDEIQAII